jgi:nucleoside-diphosphate kinase
MERALVLVKPDGVERALVGKVIDRFESAGLKVVALKMIKATEKMAGEHYMADEEWFLSVGKKTKQSYKEKGLEVNETEREIGVRVRSLLMKELTRSPIVAMVLEGNAANFVARKIAGATEPRKADPATIRGTFSVDSYERADEMKRPVRNLAHVSEDDKAAKREIKVWFTDDEIHEYKRADQDVIY